MPNNYKPQFEWIAQQLPAMRAELFALADINSGSFNAAGVGRVADRMLGLFAPLGAHAERVALQPHAATNDRGGVDQRPLGPALSLRKRPDASIRVLLGGHLDTVFAADHPFQSAREAGDEVHGPGVADLKGGLLVMYLALAALERSPWAEQIGWEVLLNPDEEIGSTGSAPLLAAAAGRNHLGLVYEPALAGGHIAMQRRGSGNFDVVVHGRAAHAGRNFAEGRNAIRAAAELVAALDALNARREGITVNVGYVHGGGSVNMVPGLCVVKLNVRTSVDADQGWLQQQLEAAVAELGRRDGIRAELRGGFTRPPKPVTPQLRTLAGLLEECGRELGIALEFKPGGGSCDGNNLAAAGLANLDTLGVVGGEIHSDREWMSLPSIVERAQLSALLLMRLASGERQWVQ